MKISSRSWITAMVSGECKSLTPRGEEIALAKVTATTEGVVVTVTMATGIRKTLSSLVTRRRKIG